YYPNYYKQDYFIEVTDDVFEALKKADRKETAYRERVRYHKAYYHLFSFCEVKYNALNMAVILTPDKVYENKAAKEQLYNAIHRLPHKQARRIYAHYFFGMSLKTIANAEGISIPAVHYSVYSGLRRLKNI
ncbi:MAG: sigma-70 family RNA polymerase sigma factor, partial [Clostridiales bacterium]|nr:sigma-70 family RNA polymerase sigma factor [Clostridiales bacterium]